MKPSPAVLGYTMLRFAIGMTMLVHGLVRIGHSQTFADSLLKMFSASILPPGVVWIFATITPPVELAIGLLVFLGLWTSVGLILGGAWMVVLIFGSSLIENWDVVGIQLVYSLIFFFLLQHLPLNSLSMDRFITSRTRNIPKG